MERTIKKFFDDLIYSSMGYDPREPNATGNWTNVFPDVSWGSSAGIDISKAALYPEGLKPDQWYQFSMWFRQPSGEDQSPFSIVFEDTLYVENISVRKVSLP